MDGRIETDAGKITPLPTQLQAINPQNVDPSSSSIESHGRFFEKVQYSLDSLEYARSGDDAGLILVFNQEKFADNSHETREGSSKDVKDITTCFGRLGFNIKKENILKDLSKEDLFREVDRVLESDLSQFNSVLVFILSHGGNCNQIHSSTTVFQLEELLKKFEECSDLKGKPKMFVIQACKGNEKTQFSDGKKDILLVPFSTYEKMGDDMVIFYSTIEGRFSFRHTDYGSWLIQEICNNFTAYGRRDDVLTLLARVIKCICTNYCYSNSVAIEKQIPVVVSTLSKKFYLNKNKDRNFVIKSTEMQDKILYCLRDIQSE